eukprot:Partr_v1_DN27064_c0_g1_i2_m28669 putative NAD-specific glutamate dehydrogenase
MTLKQAFQFHTGSHLRGKSTLSLLGLTLQLGHGLQVLAGVSTGLLLKLLDQVITDTQVKVLTTQMSITRGGQHFKDTVLNSQQRNIKSTTTQVKDENSTLHLTSLHLLVKTKGKSGGSRLIHDTKNLQTGNGTGIFSRLTLSIIEVGRHGDNGVSDLLSEVIFGNLFHLAEDHGRDFFGSELTLLALYGYFDGRVTVLVDHLEWQVLNLHLDILVIPFATNQTLGIKDSVGGVGSILVLCRLSNETLIVFSEGHPRWSNTRTQVVGDNFHATRLVDSNTRIGSSQINTDNSSIILLVIGRLRDDTDERKQGEHKSPQTGL